DRCGRARRRPGAGWLVAVGVRGTAGDRAAPAAGGVCFDPVLAPRAPDESAGRGDVRANVDLAGASRSSARDGATGVRRRRNSTNAPPTRLRALECLRDTRTDLTTHSIDTTTNDA